MMVIKSDLKSGDKFSVKSDDKFSVKSDLKSGDKFRVKRGLSLRPKTSLDKIKPYLKDLDLVLVMTVEPGFGGQTFMFDQAQKIKELDKIRKKENLSFKIEVDGGINDKTAKEVLEADVLVAGHFVFKNKPYKDPIERLRACKK